MNGKARIVWLLASLLMALIFVVSVFGVGRQNAGKQASLRPEHASRSVRPGRSATPPTMPVTATVLTFSYMPVLYNGEISLPPPLPPPTPVTGVAPIDFVGIRETLQEQDRDLAFAKIGFHVGPDEGETDTELVAWMEALDAAGVPFFLKSVDNAEPLVLAQELMAASGISHTLVYRKTGLGFDTPNYDMLPERAAEIHWERHKSTFPEELDPGRVWIETINEVDRNRVEWLGRFAVATAQMALADGYRWAAFGWSAGEPEPEDWATPSMQHFLRLAAAHPDRLAVALHEYSFTAGGAGEGYPFLVGRFQYLFDVCDRHGIPRPTVLITEWGWTYQEAPEVPAALEDIRWANWLYAAYPEVRGAAIWYLGPGFADIRLQVEPLILPLRDYALSHYFVIVQGWGAVDTWLFRP